MTAPMRIGTGRLTACGKTDAVLRIIENVTAAMTVDKPWRFDQHLKMIRPWHDPGVTRFNDSAPPLGDSKQCAAMGGRSYAGICQLPVRAGPPI